MGQGAEALLSTNSFFFTGIHRCDNRPGMVYIYEKLIHIKPRATFYASSALSGFGKFFLTLGCPGGARTHDTLINSQVLLPAELQGNIDLVLTFRFIELLRD